MDAILTSISLQEYKIVGIIMVSHKNKVLSLTNSIPDFFGIQYCRDMSYDDFLGPKI